MTICLCAQGADFLRVPHFGVARSTLIDSTLALCLGGQAVDLVHAADFGVSQGLPLAKSWPINSSDLVHVPQFGLSRHTR